VPGGGRAQGSRNKDRRANAVGLTDVFVLRAYHHEMVPGKPWSIVQRHPALRLRAMPNQVEHKGRVNMAKPRKAA
jgi:hypothetical protein